MPDLSRRDFLKGALAGLGALLAARFLSACSPAAPAAAVPAAAAPVKPIPQPSEAVAQSTTYPDLVVVKGGEAEDLVRRAVEALGGMKRFVRKGDNVIVKPNIGPPVIGYEYAATTNPWVMGAIVKMCMEAGAGRVRVMDTPFGGTAEAAYAASGIREQVEKAGGEIQIISRFKFVPTELPQGRNIKKWDIYEDILKADVLINVPIAKHHMAAKLSLAMKNLMGIIDRPQQFHQSLHQRIADLASRVRPALNVIDAVRILIAHGPSGGDLNDVRKLDTIIASTDIVAADSCASTLFGLKADDIPYIYLASDMGIGRADLSALNIKEIKLGA